MAFILADQFKPPVNVFVLFAFLNMQHNGNEFHHFKNQLQ